MKLLKQAAAVAIIALLPVASNATPIQWTVGSGGNGHWYEFIGTPSTEQFAFAAAASSTYLGMQGYLATITSAAENLFVAYDVAGWSIAWIGGTDSAAEGVWKWVGGPEAGQTFTYTNWALAEPNNGGGGEYYLQINSHGFGLQDDYASTTFPFQTNGGFVVEYSAAMFEPVPEPASLGMLASGLLLLGLRRRRNKV